MKKTIGFVDYYINEWHANNYVGWIREASEKIGYDFEVKYAWAELECDPKGEMSTDEWCGKYGVTKCATIDELCEKSDYIIVLAPSNPETHLRYAEAVLKYKKTYPLYYLNDPCTCGYKFACVFERTSFWRRCRGTKRPNLINTEKKDRNFNLGRKKKVRFYSI